MAEKLHIEDAELRELLHLVSHDIRNPLAAIVTNLEFARRLVVEDNVDQDLRESVEDSVVACDVLKRIVSNFDILTKGSQTNATLQNLDVVSLVRDVAKRCGERAAQAELTIEVEDDGTDERPRLDKQLFSLALENLIANSVQHAPRGSVVRILVGKADGHLTVTVRDAGKAVPPDHRELALSPQSHTPKGRQAPTRYGRGLSLLAARGAASITGVGLSLGGEDGGFEMTLTIPLDANG